jgi:hypothetical protein
MLVVWAQYSLRPYLFKQGVSNYTGSTKPCL